MYLIVVRIWQAAVRPGIKAPHSKALGREQAAPCARAWILQVAWSLRLEELSLKPPEHHLAAGFGFQGWPQLY